MLQILPPLILAESRFPIAVVLVIAIAKQLKQILLSEHASAQSMQH
jgi:hypothetical protein